MVSLIDDVDSKKTFADTNTKILNHDSDATMNIQFSSAPLLMKFPPSSQ